MKYVILIMDGAAGEPIPEKNGKTSLEVAHIPHLHQMAQNGQLGLTLNIPEKLEASSAVACMSVMGYDPRQFYSGRGPVEAYAMGITLEPGDVAFRCNLVTYQDGKLVDHSAGHITNEDAHPLIKSIQEKLGSSSVTFYPGEGYRHIAVFKKGEELLKAACTPPHDVPGQPFIRHVPKGEGSRKLNDLMIRSEDILKGHPVNQKRAEKGKKTATAIWLFWGGKRPEGLPSFESLHKAKAAMTSGVDLLRGLAAMSGMKILQIPGVTGDLTNDYDAQAEGALKALETHDVVFIHVESPDEAGHMGSAEEKIKALEMIDYRMVKRLLKYKNGALRIMALPDHPTPVFVRTHTRAPVPFILYGPGFTGNGAKGYTEKEADNTKLFVSEGHHLLAKLFHQ